MDIEQLINHQLNKYPLIKNVIKRCYQSFMCAVSPKFKAEGSIIRVSPNDSQEYFFGYYDKSPWDASGRYMICLRARDTWSDVAPSEPANILLIDTEDNYSYKVIATTHSWNVQQGCMAQWLGPKFDKEIIYNDFRNNNYCSVVLNIETMVERVLPIPVYAVALDGKTALSLDFSRLHRLRKGYGYSNIPDSTIDDKIPDKTCIWKLDIQEGIVTDLLKYADLVNFAFRAAMNEGEHKVNHIMINPSGTRFMFMHRWYIGKRQYTRLLTCDIDGTNMYALKNKYGASHCDWKNDQEILAFARYSEGNYGYYLMKDKTQEHIHLWTRYSNDGHPSYSPDRKLIVTDTYPNRSRIAEIKLFKDTDIEAKEMRVIARVFAPFKYDNDTRCDLHPRWSRDGKMVCFDSVFEGHRGLYIVKL